MPGTLIARLACTVAVTLLIFAAQSTAAQADDFPAGVACAFPLRFESQTPPTRVTKEFTDKNGEVVRTLAAGKGNTLTFTNLDTGETLVLTTGGSVEHLTINPDVITSVSTGHNVLILFPSDVPAGPSTTLYMGNLVYTIDKTTGVFTVQSVSGRQTDICAALFPTDVIDDAIVWGGR